MRLPSGLKPRKSLGQHFILSDALLSRIADACELNDDDIVLEIGAGFGNLTAHLIERAKKVFAVEADQKLLSFIPTEIKNSQKVEWICTDILKLDWTQFSLGAQKIVVVGNIPYYIASPIIKRAVEHRNHIKKAIMLLQSEFAERIASRPNSRKYGATSVFCQSYGEVKLLFEVAASQFWPRPEIGSRLLKIELLDQPPFEVPEENFFEKVVRTFFQQRRKTILNAFKRCGVSEARARAILDKLNLQPNLRPENLDPKTFGKIALEIEAAIKKARPR